MISIYICDDEETVRHQIKDALQRKILMENYDMKVLCAATARELLNALEDNRRNIYFLDVDLEDEAWDGFTLGQELRRRDPHGTLIYITGYGDLAWKTFQYHLEAFDYIVKDKEQTGPFAARCLDAVHARRTNAGIRRKYFPCGRGTKPGTSPWRISCSSRPRPKRTTFSCTQRTAG